MGTQGEGVGCWAVAVAKYSLGPTCTTSTLASFSSTAELNPGGRRCCGHRHFDGGQEMAAGQLSAGSVRYIQTVNVCMSGHQRWGGGRGGGSTLTDSNGWPTSVAQTPPTDPDSTDRQSGGSPPLPSPAISVAQCSQFFPGAGAGHSGRAGADSFPGCLPKWGVRASRGCRERWPGRVGVRILSRYSAPVLLG